MNTVTRFVPFRSPLEGIAVLQNRLNSIFNDFASPNGGLQNETLSAGSETDGRVAGGLKL